MNIQLLTLAMRVGCVACSLVWPQRASAQASAALNEFDDTKLEGPAITHEAIFTTACAEAKFFASHGAGFDACYGAQAGWSGATQAGKDFTSKACGVTETGARDDLKKAQAGLAKARADVVTLTAEVKDHQREEEAWTASTEAGRTQHLIDARKAREEAQAALVVAQKQVEEGQKALEAANAANAKLAGRDAAFKSFQVAIAKAENQERNEAEFEALLRDQARRTACLELYKHELEVFVTMKSETDDAKKQAADDHEQDTLRKAQGTASATTTTSSLVENPGSPDYIAYSVLMALGADAKTTGTQSILTLNVSSLLWTDEKERLAQPAWQRNLFIRGAFPLATTDRVPQTGEGATSADSTEEISRFSVLAGGSLLDESDTRLPTNQDCYELVLSYVRFPQTAGPSAGLSEERKRYYDVCARISANKHRLAWRAGVGFYTPNDENTPKTRPELVVGALVWGPRSQIYINALYQGILRPSRIDNMGVGLSFAGNAGGKASGVDAFARVGVDFIFLVAYGHADKSLDWEARFVPTVRGKLFGNSIGTFGLGPRFIGSKLDSPGVMATVALTYDADALVNSLLTPPESQVATTN